MATYWASNTERWIFASLNLYINRKIINRWSMVLNAERKKLKHSQRIRNIIVVNRIEYVYNENCVDKFHCAVKHVFEIAVSINSSDIFSVKSNRINCLVDFITVTKWTAISMNGQVAAEPVHCFPLSYGVCNEAFVLKDINCVPYVWWKYIHHRS